MTKDKLKKVFEECERTRQGIRVEILMPNGDIETIINTNNSLEFKKRFYLKNYDEELVNLKNDRIKIVDAGPIQIKRRPKAVTIFKEI